jgi:hypothetical protein
VNEKGLGVVRQFQDEFTVVLVLNTGHLRQHHVSHECTVLDLYESDADASNENENSGASRVIETECTKRA